MSDLFQAHIEEWLQKIAPLWGSEHLESYRQDIDRLLDSGVQSYDDFYRLMRDTSAPEELRKQVVYLAGHLRGIDRRRAVPPLLAELRNQQSTIWWEAANTLGFLRSKRAIRPLLQTALDKSNARDMRRGAVYALAFFRDRNSSTALLHAMTDKTDDPYVRGEVIDQHCHSWDASAIAPLVECLSDESAEVRFWACFGLCTLAGYVDSEDVISALDRVAATDDGFGDHFWHVRREALGALESIYYSLRVGCEVDDEGCRTCGGAPVYLISPLVEYWDFGRAGWRQEGETHVWSPLEQTTGLRIDPVWLADQLRQQWPDARIGVREPKMQSLLLDWEIGEVARPLIGGLQCDGYSVSLTGRSDAPVAEFAVWYRGVIPDAYRLFLYQWADVGCEIEVGSIVEDIVSKLLQRFTTDR